MAKLDLPRGKYNLHSYVSDNGACAHLRIIFPTLMLNQLKTKDHEFYSTHNMTYIDQPEFYSLLSIVKFQRAATREHYNMIRRLYTRRENTRHKFGLLYEIDDALGPYIPHYNFARDFYIKNWEPTQEILKLVDGILVSTDDLKNLYGKYNENIIVIENRLPGWLWNQKSAKERIEQNNKKPRILWAGSFNHFNEKGGDFNKQLINFIEKTSKEYEWVFVGAVPPALESNKNIEKHGWLKMVDFGHYLDYLEPDIGIAPLDNNIFNCCKSNLKMLEFCSLGIPGVYSNVSPYKKAQLKTNKPEEFISNIEKLANDLDFREKVYNKDIQAIGGEESIYMTDEWLKRYASSHFKLIGYNIKWGS